MAAKRTFLVQIEASITWEAFKNEQTGVWIGICEALNLNAIGDTWEELQQSANEAMQLLFTDLFREGELSKFLRLNGWRIATPLPKPDAKRPKFDIPFSISQRPRQALVTA